MAMNHTAVAMSDGGGGAISLNVDTTQLITYGNYLVSSKATLDTCLDSLNTKMDTITSGWKDEDGEAFKSKFSLFITEAKKINTEIESLGNYAVKVAAKYETLLAESLKLMGE